MVVEEEMFASPRSRTVALLLAGLLGMFGAHRFYVGKTKSAIFQICTLGGLGLWYLADVILVATGSFRDAEGRLVTNWDPESDRLLNPGSANSILDELDALRSEVAELHERVDFAERLLSGGPATRGDQTSHSPTGRGDAA